MDAGAPWTCAACGARSADYRRRCPECGARRPAAAAPSREDLGPTPGVDGSLPPPDRAAVAPAAWRGARGKDRSWPTIVGSLAVLGLAAYGLVTYLGSGRPSAAEDEAALLAALPVGADRASAEVVRLDDRDGDTTGILGCPTIDEDIVELVGAHGVVAVLGATGPAERVTHLIAFDRRSAAIRYDELVALALVDGCLEDPCCVAVGLDGRAWISTEGPDATADLAEVEARLDLDG